MESSRTHRGVRAALSVFLLLQRGALGLRNVGAELRADVPLIHARLLVLHVSLVLLNDLAWRLDVAGAGRDLVRLLKVVRHQLVVLVVAHLSIKRSQVALAHHGRLLVAASLHFVAGCVVRAQPLVRMRVARLSVLGAKICLDPARLSGVLRLARRLLIFVSVAEHRIVTNPVHL